MAEKLPVIIDNRGEGRALHMLQRFSLDLQSVDVTTTGPFLPPQEWPEESGKLDGKRNE